MDQTNPSNPILEKFQQIESNFNKNFLIYLYQTKQIYEGETGEKDVQQANLLEQGYAKWYEVLQEDPSSFDACHSFYQHTKDYHDILLARDEQFFSNDKRDFLESVLQQKGIDTMYLYNQLGEGGDKPEDEDAKNEYWITIISLYRLSILICVYLRLPVVREIISLILAGNPGLNQSNITEKIFSDFKGNKKLRRLIMKLLKSTTKSGKQEDTFGDIFESLSRVISTFSSETNLDANLKNNMKISQNKVRSLFDSILCENKVDHKLTEDQKTDLIAAFDDKNKTVIETMIKSGVLHETEMANVHEAYSLQNLSKMNVMKTVGNLGNTMTDMLAAIENNDESAMQSILGKAGGNLSMSPGEMEEMELEMSQLETESLADEDSSDA